MTVLRTGSVRFGKDCASGSTVGFSGAPVDFDRDEFAKLLESKGYSVLWQKAALCPNRPRAALSPRDHAIDCSVCDGNGFVYFDEASTRMLITSVSLNQSFLAYGRLDVGQIMVTGLPEFRLHEWDRLVLENGVARFHELVMRQPEGSSDRLKYAPLCVDFVAWMPRDQSGSYRTSKVGRDFVIGAGDSAGSIVWTGTENRPDPYDYYSIAYEYRPRYVVIDLVHQHRESTVNGRHVEFPVQAVAKLEYLIRDESKDASESRDQNPFPAP